MKKIIFIAFAILVLPLFAKAESFSVDINNESNVNEYNGVTDVESDSNTTNFCSETVSLDQDGINSTIATCNSQGVPNTEGGEAVFTNGFTGNQSIEVVNNDTGAESKNTASFRSGVTALFRNLNKIGLLNNICFEALTGENATNANTGNGSISTGNADIEISVENRGNVNEIEFIEGGGRGGGEEEVPVVPIVPSAILGAAAFGGGRGGGVGELASAGVALPVIAFMVYLLFSIYLAKRFGGNK